MLGTLECTCNVGKQENIADTLMWTNISDIYIYMHFLPFCLEVQVGPGVLEVLAQSPLGLNHLAWTYHGPLCCLWDPEITKLGVNGANLEIHRDATTYALVWSTRWQTTAAPDYYWSYNSLPRGSTLIGEVSSPMDSLWWVAQPLQLRTKPTWLPGKNAFKFLTNETGQRVGMKLSIHQRNKHINLQSYTAEYLPDACSDLTYPFHVCPCGTHVASDKKRKWSQKGLSEYCG